MSNISLSERFFRWYKDLAIEQTKKRVIKVFFKKYPVYNQFLCSTSGNLHMKAGWVCFWGARVFTLSRVQETIIFSNISLPFLQDVLKDLERKN